MAKLSPSHARFNELMSNAVAHHQAGRLMEAAPFYSEALKIDPKDADALRLLGGLYVQAEMLPQAEEFLERAQKEQPTNPEILNNLGIVARNSGDTERALGFFRQALQLRPAYAEALNNLGSALHANNQIKEAMDYYRQALQVKPDYTTALRNLGVALRDTGRPNEALAPLREAQRLSPADAPLMSELALTLHRAMLYEEAAVFYDKACALQPDFFVTLVNSAILLRDFNKPIESIARLQQALAVKPNSPEVFINIAAAFWDMNRLDLAIDNYRHALTLRPDWPEALINMGATLWAAGQHEEAAGCYHKALAINPQNPDALTNLGALRHEFGLLDEAMDFYRRALEIKADHAGALWRKSMILLATGDYAEGWKLYEVGTGQRGCRDIPRFVEKMWDGQPMPGKRLLIWGEQGLGDSLQFVRYAALAKPLVGELAVMCPTPIGRLFRQCPFIDRVIDQPEDVQFDAQASMMSLPYLFGTLIDTIPAQIPYLFVAPQVQTFWDQRFQATENGQIKAGLVWAGGAREGQVNANLTDRKRSMSLQAMRGLLEVEGFRFYNLQMGPSVGQIAQLGLQDRFVDYMSEVKDFMDTAAIVNNLDLVITVDTSVAHLAGALGKPVWVLSRYDACWRWLRNQPTNPWYPTARVFGQPAMGDWESAVDNLKQAMVALRNEKRLAVQE